MISFQIKVKQLHNTKEINKKNWIVFKRKIRSIYV